MCWKISTIDYLGSQPAGGFRSEENYEKFKVLSG